jgi:hypothetical protein
LRNLGIGGSLSILNYRFYPLIPQFGANRHNYCPKKRTIFIVNCEVCYK